MTAAESYLSYLRDLAQLSDQVEAAARQQDWDLLSTCLEQRQALMDQVDALPDQSRDLTAEQNAEATRLLELIQERDEVSKTVIDTAIVSTRSVLHEGSQTRAGISAYRRASGNKAQILEARFVDKNR